MSETYSKYSMGANKALDRTQQEAKRLGCNPVLPKCLLLGVLRSGGTATLILSDHMGIRPQDVASTLEAHIDAKPEIVVDEKLPYSDACGEVFELAVKISKTLRHSHVGTEHFLLALLIKGEEPVKQVLAEFGLTFRGFREKVVDLMGEGPKSEDLEDGE